MINPRREHLPQPDRQRQHDLATTRASDGDRVRVPTEEDDRVTMLDSGSGAHTTTLPALRAALAAIPDEAWTEPSNYQANKIHHLYQRHDLVRAGEWDLVPFPLLDLMVQLEQDQGAAVHDAWLSRIGPGGFIVPHTDASRWRERWHIPIQCAGITVLEDERLFDAVGEPFRVQHWLPHSVENVANQDRIHLVIDLDRYAGPTEPAPFRIL